MSHSAKWIAILLVFAYLVILFLPADYEVQRTITINAPVEYVFSNVSTFPMWSKWSTWAQKDPYMVNNYRGQSEGVGQIYEWKSEHPDLGSGRQEIIRIIDNRQVKTALDFGFLGQSESDILLQSTDSRTIVKWRFTPKYSLNPVPRLFGILSDMESYIGPDFEDGLENLKAISENDYLESDKERVNKIALFKAQAMTESEN